MIATLQSAGAGVSGPDGGVRGPDAGVRVPNVGANDPEAGVSNPIGGPHAGVSGPDALDDDDDDSINNFCPEVVKAIEGVKFIAEHLKREDEARYVSSSPLQLRILYSVRRTGLSVDCFNQITQQCRFIGATSAVASGPGDEGDRSPQF